MKLSPLPHAFAVVCLGSLLSLWAAPVVHGGANPLSQGASKREDVACQASAQPRGVGDMVESSLKSQVEQILPEVPGRWGVYVRHLDTGQTVAVSADEIFHPASTVKLAIGLEVMAWLEQHPQVRLVNAPPGGGRSYQELLYAMLVPSEEEAAGILMDFLERQPGLDFEAQLKTWGAACTTITPRRTTPADLGLLWGKLYRGELLGQEATQTLLRVLRAPSPPDRERIGGGLPESVRAGLAHKTGTLFQDGWGVVADGGVVTTPTGAYVIVVIGNAVQWVDLEAAMKLIARISRLTYLAFAAPALDAHCDRVWSREVNPRRRAYC